MLNQIVPTIPVCDLDRSVEFYCNVLGFRVVHGIDGELVYCEHNGSLIALARMPEVPSERRPVQLGCVVTHLEKARTELESCGAVFVGEDVDLNVARIAFFDDPDGTPMYLWQWTRWTTARVVDRMSVEHEEAGMVA